MWNSLLVSALFGMLGVLMSAFGYKLFDLIETKVGFAEEIKKGEYGRRRGRTFPGGDLLHHWKDGGELSRRR